MKKVIIGIVALVSINAFAEGSCRSSICTLDTGFDNNLKAFVSVSTTEQKNISVFLFPDYGIDQAHAKALKVAKKLQAAGICKVVIDNTWINND